jgi:hypothetical protein
MLPIRSHRWMTNDLTVSNVPIVHYHCLRGQMMIFCHQVIDIKYVHIMMILIVVYATLLSSARFLQLMTYLSVPIGDAYWVRYDAN